MKIKTRQYYTPIRLAKIEKQPYNFIYGEEVKEQLYTLLVGMQNSTTTLGAFGHFLQS